MMTSGETKHFIRDVCMAVLFALLLWVLIYGVASAQESATPPKVDELVTAWMQSVVLSSQIRDAKAKVLQALPEYKEYEVANKNLADIKAATDKKIDAKYKGLWALDWAKGVLVSAPPKQVEK